VSKDLATKNGGLGAPGLLGIFEWNFDLHLGREAMPATL
jgi:hypothetical protein